jgi:predicted oxidoreductase
MKQGYGVAEEAVGRWLQRSGHRDDIVLATKVYQPMGLGPNDRRLSAYHIRRACEASLRRLQTDHIDLYQMHHVDRATPWEEIWQAMEQLVREGKISYVGSSNFAAWDVALAQCAASARHFMGLTCEQSLYNLAVRAVELELIPALRSLGIGLIPYSPLHAGLLAGVLGTATERGIFDDSTQQRIEAHRNQLEAHEGPCRSWALSRWTWRWPGCCASNGTTRPDLAGAGGSPAGVRLVRLTPVPATGPFSPDKAATATREPFWEPDGTNGPIPTRTHWRPCRAVRHCP